MPKKNAAAIRSANPLPLRDIADPVAVCNVCGQPSARLGAYQAHDERDHPLPMPASLVFIGKDHLDCMRAMEKHPRLYAEAAGLPGHFPFLCGPCPQRAAMLCRHPKLKANGGPGPDGEAVADESARRDHLPAAADRAPRLCVRGAPRDRDQLAGRAVRMNPAACWAHQQYRYVSAEEAGATFGHNEGHPDCPACQRRVRIVGAVMRNAFDHVTAEEIESVYYQPTPEAGLSGGDMERAIARGINNRGSY